MIHRDWYGLYRESWQGEIVDEAFAHPAKFSRALIRRIYQHALEMGYIKPGDTIVDSFGGVALGALDAMRYGLHWRGVELEERFVKLGNDNLALWQERYAAAFPGWGTARLVQGDSRQLASVLQGAGACVSSPPYAHSMDDDTRPGGGIDLAKVKHPRSSKGKNFQGNLPTSYGRTPGQLGAMPEGDVASACVSSPPYVDAVNGTGEGPGARYDHKYHNGANATKASSSNGYGRSEGNLGAMGACVSSPPFEGVHSVVPVEARARQVTAERVTGHIEYNSTNVANIGNDTGDTFWTAARAIVEQVHAVLRPGGVVIWVCGDFVRNGERVHFGRQWLQLCQACGFAPLEWITAWKREPGPVQLALVGDDRDHTIDRVSFFRRLANKRNPDAAILNEDVIFVRKEATP